MKKKIVSFILAMATLLSLFAIPHAATGTFVDVSTSHWAYSYIQQAFEDGAINGTSYNEQTGVRTFSPDANVTWAQVIAVLTRAFYADEVAASTATGNWWAKNEEVAKRHKLLTRWASTTELTGIDDDPQGITRGFMAEILCRLLDDHGVKLRSTMHPEERMDDQGEPVSFTDWMYHESFGIAIHDVACAGIMGGYPDGSFKKSGKMTRAEFSAIYVRAKNLINEHRQAQAERPIPYGPVGTMSDFDVELSMATHYAGDTVPDYWSEQTDAVKAVFATETLRVALNAYIHTALNAQTILTEGRPEATTEEPIVRYLANDFYNYPVFKDLGASDLESTARRFMNSLHLPLSLIFSSKDGQTIYTPYIMYQNEKVRNKFDAIIARFTPGMSDREKVKVMLEAMDETWDYELDKTSHWHDDGIIKADCGPFAVGVNELFSYAGIPTMAWVSDEANHAANFCFLPDEGVWVIVDASHYVVAVRNRISAGLDPNLVPPDICWSEAEYVADKGYNPMTPGHRAIADIVTYLNQRNPWLYGNPAPYYESLIPN